MTTAREIYHIETLSPEDEGGRVVQRTSVRTESEAAAVERAVALFRRSRVPQARGPAVDGVRVLNGAGYEVFSLSARDEAFRRNG